MATLTLDQKRLSQLRTQLYGKPSDLKSSKKTPLTKNTTTNKDESQNTHNSSLITNHQTDSYIKKDLTKVLILSSFILVVQFAVYYALANKWLAINFYGITY